MTERLHDRNGFGSSQDIQSEDMSENAKRVSDNEVQMSSDDEEDVEDRSDMDESNNIVDSEVPISDIDGIETYYRPIKGEDIYGRQFGEDTNNGSITQKYIPPAARSQVEILKEIEVCYIPENSYYFIRCNTIYLSLHYDNVLTSHFIYINFLYK